MGRELFQFFQQSQKFESYLTVVAFVFAEEQLPVVGESCQFDGGAADIDTDAHGGPSLPITKVIRKKYV